MQLKVLTTIILSLILGLVAFGQSLSLDSNVLPSNFRPNDFNSVFTALQGSKTDSPKGEFETTEQYNNRKKIQIRTGDNQTVDENLYFIYPASQLAKYNADTEEFTIEIPTESFYKLNSTGLLGVVGSSATSAKRYHSTALKESIVRNDGTYVATNTYGAQVTVTKSSIYKHRLVFTNFNEVEGGRTSGGEPILIANFSLPLAKAQEAKQNLAILYITKLVSPYLDTKSSLQEATFNKPKEVLNMDYYLFGNVIEIWVVNTTSKEVLTKLKPTDGLFTNPDSANRLIGGKMIFKPLPEYPKAARAVRASGVVQVRVVVDESGNVISATANGHPLLKAAAESAALRTKFTPSTQAGKPVKISTVITYTFNP